MQLGWRWWSGFVYGRTLFANFVEAGLAWGRGYGILGYGMVGASLSLSSTCKHFIPGQPFILKHPTQASRASTSLKHFTLLARIPYLTLWLITYTLSRHSAA